MLVLKKEMYLEDFEQEFDFELRGVSSEATAIIFDSLCEVNYNGDSTVDSVSDYLRFQVQVMSISEVINDYSYSMDLDGLDVEDLEDEATIEAVTKYLEDNTYLLGTYEEDGETFFIFDEF